MPPQQASIIFIAHRQINNRCRHPNLGKLLKALADHGLLESQKGKGGSFRLARDADRISLFEIMEPIEHVSRWGGCFLGRPGCSNDAPCAMHQRWAMVRDGYLEFLRETAVADLTRQQRTRSLARR